MPMQTRTVARAVLVGLPVGPNGPVSAASGPGEAQWAAQLMRRDVLRHVSGQRDLCRGARESDRLPARIGDPKHHLMDGLSGVHIADREDRPPVVPATERMERIRTAEPAILRQQGGFRVGGAPVTPGGDHHGGLRQRHPGLAHRAGECLAGEGVDDRPAAQVEHQLVGS